jgi:branched-chain amino acid transport system substrate-binding protein
MRSKRWLAVAAAGALLGAACGNDDGGSAPTTAAPGTTAAPTTAAPGTTDAPTTDAPAPTGYVVNLDDCEDPEAAAAPIEGDVIIGTSLPLSGGPAVLFAPYSAGFQAYFDYINAQGGVNGQRYKAIVKDDQYLANLAVTNVEELVESEGAHVISGVIGSPGNAAIQEDLNAQCIPHLWAATGAPDWGAIDQYPWSSGALIVYEVEARGWLEFAKSQFPNGGTAALFYVNNEFGQSYATAFKALVAEYGFDLVAEERIDAADSGAPSGQMTNLVAANPDIILAVPLGAQCIAYMIEEGNAKAANTSFTPLTYITATCANPVFFGVPGPAADGVYTSANLKDVNNADLRANDPAVKAYLEAFAGSGSSADPGGIAVAGWIAAELTHHVVVQAAKNCGYVSQECIINAVRNIDYVPSLYRDGLRAVMGPDDGYVAEGLQIQQWSLAAGGFVDASDVLNFEGTTGVYKR